MSNLERDWMLLMSLSVMFASCVYFAVTTTLMILFMLNLLGVGISLLLMGMVIAKIKEDIEIKEIDTVVRADQQSKIHK